MNTFIHHMKSTRNLRKMIINHKALDSKLCPLPLTAEGMQWMENDNTYEKQTKLWVPIKYHNPDFLKWTMNIGLSITDIELFCNPANHSMPVHLDGNELHDEFKLNYAFNPRGNSLMNWFKPKPNTIGKREGVRYKNKDERNIDTADLYWYPEEVDLIESHDVEVSIVQVGQPHNVTTTQHPRKCLSCVFDKRLVNGYTTNEDIILKEDLHIIAKRRDEAVGKKILQDIVPMWEAIDLFKKYII
jgi:hypothetical protein